MSKRKSFHNNTKKVSNSYRKYSFGNSPVYDSIEQFYADVNPVLKHIARYRYAAMVEANPDMEANVCGAILKYALIRFAGKYKKCDPLTFTLRDGANLAALLKVLHYEGLGSELDMYVYKFNKSTVDAWLVKDFGKEFAESVTF